MDNSKTCINKSGLVSKADSLKKNDGDHDDAGQTNLIINYLPTDMTENELLDIFSKIGEVVEHKIIRHRHSGLSLGYGFVMFKTTNAARIAQVMCNGHEVRGKSLKVAFARPRSQDTVNSNLYVAYLPPDIDESKLAELFGRYGTIIEVKILRYPFTGKSRGVGFVRFDQRMAAEVAIKALNNYVLKDDLRPITVQIAKGPKWPEYERVCFSPNDDTTNSGLTHHQIDPETQPAAKRSQEPIPPPRHMKPKIQQAAIIPWNIYKEHFEKCFRAKSCTINMEYPKTFDNKSGLVSKADTSKKNDGELVSVSEANQTNLIINYLPTDMTENELLNIFSKFGEVVDHKIIRHRHSGLSLGYGFVVFKNTNAARIAQIMCNGHEVRGKSLKVAFARPRSQDIVNANLHVTYLPPDIDESKLTELFGRYGTIIEVRVLRWPTGKPRGSGFVRFDQRMAAEVALNALNNYVLKEATRPITVQFAKDHKSPKDATNSGPTNKIDLGTQPAGKRCQEPNSPPRPIKRQISEEPYPFPPPVERHIKQFQVDPRIHKLQMDPDTQPFGKRSQGPNLAEIEHTAKRAGGYVVPYKHT